GTHTLHRKSSAQIRHAFTIRFPARKPRQLAFPFHRQPPTAREDLMAALSKRRRLAVRAAGIGTATLVLGATIAAAATYLHAGPQGDGTAITPVGYRVTPAGSQTDLGDLPL